MDNKPTITPDNCNQYAHDLPAGTPSEREFATVHEWCKQHGMPKMEGKGALERVITFLDGLKK